MRIQFLIAGLFVITTTATCGYSPHLEGDDGAIGNPFQSPDSASIDGARATDREWGTVDVWSAVDRDGFDGTTATDSGDASNVDAPVATDGAAGRDGATATDGAIIADAPIATGGVGDAPVATGGTGAGGIAGAGGSGGAAGAGGRAGGATNAGGTATGGVVLGGAGGTATGGAATGGTNSGGTATGGVVTGGMSVGGTGGVVTGGTSTGGTSSGGTATGGAGSGGTSSGGTATGGTATGGTATGGTSTGGAGGVGTGGAGGTGGAAVCLGSATKCTSDNTGVQTCTSGQWGTAVPCGTHQTCTGPVGTAQCTCNASICSVTGPMCSGPRTVSTCLQDADTSCLYLAPFDMTCAAGACVGDPGSASCCTNECTVATCLSSTSLSTCDPGANGCTTSGTLDCSSSGLVCERSMPATCADPNWAEWPMPNSEAGAPNPASYTINADGTTTDNVTGLMWQTNVPSATYLWANAGTVCPGLSLAGYNDWRLPTLIELMSIVDYTTYDPSINGYYFPSTPAESFWCACPAPYKGGSIAFNVGSGGCSVDALGTYYIRCVR